jgi:nitrate/TMAO reductase-like tetraheme cytochrome c subunit
MRAMRLPVAARNPVSLVGMAVATAMAVLFLILVALQLLGWLRTPYIGLLVFVAVPVVFVAGLLLIPVGVWRTRRSPGRSGADPAWPVIDLGHPHTRTVLMSVLVLTVVNVAIVSVAAFGAVHHIESAEFCGQTCHTTMEPQAVAHQAWPHARVACTQCHIGPGPDAFVEAKLAGTRQLWQIATNNVPKPVPSPQRLISSTNATCGGCHSGFMHERDEVRVLREYADDEANTETATTLRMHVGGGRGSHRHNALAIEFPAAEKASETISYVRVRYPDGRTREFRPEGSSGAAGELRRMDCTDCHNRPAHTFSFTPQRAVDGAIAAGRL